MTYRDPKYIYWDYFENWYNCMRTLQPRAACYSLTYNETKPSQWQKPYEFEETVYIGEAAGLYADACSPSNNRVRYRSNVHNRLANHYTNLVNGNTKHSSYKEIVSRYGYGKKSLSGVLTGKPAWICLLVPKDDIPDHALKSWSIAMEADMILSYQLKWKNPPIGNVDRWSKERKIGSKSSMLLDNVSKNNLSMYINEQN